MLQYCENCQKETETHVITQQETYNVLGEQITIMAQVAVCNTCGNEVYACNLDTENLKQAYNVYRKRHKLLFPAEIKEIREQYGLSQRGFAKLLNWGDKTISRYERGALQDAAHNSLLLFLRKPENMREYLRVNDILLPENQKKKLLQQVDSLLNKTNYDNLSNLQYETKISYSMTFAVKNTQALVSKAYPKRKHQFVSIGSAIADMQIAV